MRGRRRRPKRRSSLRRREALTGYAFISPWLVGFVLFMAGPILASFILSFTRWNIVSSPKWVGLKNYIQIFTADPRFVQSLKATFLYAVRYLPLTLVTALSVGIAMNIRVRGIGIFRTLFYLPYVVPAVAQVLIWMWIFNPYFGLLNYGLSKLGIPGPNWLGNPFWAPWAIVIMSLWGVGGTAVVYLAGLQNIPKHLYEAAMVDGANVWQRFRHITLPLLTPTIFFQLVIELIGVFKTFTAPFIATQGGPLGSTYFYMLYIYQKAFVSMRMGYGSALAWILTVIILAITVLVFRSSPYWVYYEAERRRG
jgi:multiple sugar transport system permease protein